MPTTADTKVTFRIIGYVRNIARLATIFFCRLEPVARYLCFNKCNAFFCHFFCCQFEGHKKRTIVFYNEYKQMDSLLIIVHFIVIKNNKGLSLKQSCFTTVRTTPQITNVNKIYNIDQQDHPYMRHLPSHI